MLDPMLDPAFDVINAFIEDLVARILFLIVGAILLQVIQKILPGHSPWIAQMEEQTYRRLSRIVKTLIMGVMIVIALATL